MSTGASRGDDVARITLRQLGYQTRAKAVTGETSLLFDEVLRQRRSVRAFKSNPVPLALVRELLDCARRAPSGTNIQPWKVHVVAGETRRRLEAEVLAHRETGPTDTSAEFPRAQRTEPYVTRARTLGKAMYSLIGVPRGDLAAGWAQWGRNYKFFDAPVGLIFTIDKSLDCMSFLDTGMFIQTFLLAAKARGLDTCPQGAWNAFWTVTRRVLNVPEDEWIVCGVSLGWADESHPVNTLVAEREPIEAFATFHGFEEDAA